MVALVALGQVLFDISMAPLMDPHAAHHEDPALRAVEPKPTEEKKRRWDIGDAVRKGAPSELRRDLYFHFIEGSWTRIFVSLFFVFFFSNVVFAALYLLDSSAISGVREGNFVDAFAFSVQTMTTIGYGTMSPASDYAHLLVTLEAVVGVVTFALATGLVFAKASQAKSSVLFSENIVFTMYDGKPTMMLRVGNARGNEVVEATMRVSALLDEVTPEGHKMRKLYDLALVRDNSPLFTLSWTVMHVLDESSPLHGCDADTIEKLGLFGIVCTLTGHDATYGQTTHARKIYLTEDFRFGHRFVDVISDLEDGRLMLDFEKFHDTEPDPAVAA